MAAVKISGLTSATAALSDIIEIESSGGVSGKETLQQIYDLFVANMGAGAAGKIEWYDDYYDPSAAFPYLCLSDDDKILNVSNWPDLVPHLRTKKLKYMPGTASAQSDFNVTNYAISSNVVTLTFADLTPEKAILSALAEDQLVHGSFTGWRTVTLAASVGAVPSGTYALTAISAASRTISFAYTTADASGSITTTAAFYPHRVDTATDAGGTMARHFAVKGRSLVSPNDAAGECFAGLRRRDRMQGHRHDVSYSGSGTGFPQWISAVGSFGKYSSPTDTALQATLMKTDGTNGTPRTGTTTDTRALVAIPYMWGKSYVA